MKPKVFLSARDLQTIHGNSVKLGLNGKKRFKAEVSARHPKAHACITLVSKKWGETFSSSFNWKFHFFYNILKSCVLKVNIYLYWLMAFLNRTNWRFNGWSSIINWLQSPPFDFFFISWDWILCLSVITFVNREKNLAWRVLCENLKTLQTSSADFDMQIKPLIFSSESNVFWRHAAMTLWWGGKCHVKSHLLWWRVQVCHILSTLIPSHASVPFVTCFQTIERNLILWTFSNTANLVQMNIFTFQHLLALPLLFIYNAPLPMNG